MIIGLTGQTGAGKSSAGNILKNMGFYVIDADKIARRVTASEEILIKLRSLFGDGVISPDGTLNRRALGEIVFSDREKLERLNALTHPEIVRIITAEAKAHEREGAVIDCALLEECGLSEICDKIINITAPRDVRLSRIMERDGLSRREALNRINCQRPFSGNCVPIDNSASLSELGDKLKEALCPEKNQE